MQFTAGQLSCVISAFGASTVAGECRRRATCQAMTLYLTGHVAQKAWQERSRVQSFLPVKTFAIASPSLLSAPKRLLACKPILPYLDILRQCSTSLYPIMTQHEAANVTYACQIVIATPAMSPQLVPRAFHTT